MLGVAAFGARWRRVARPAEFPVQAIVAAAPRRRRLLRGARSTARDNRAQQMAPIDAGMPASFESWIDPAARLARVRYRGASWDARVEGVEARMRARERRSTCSPPMATRSKSPRTRPA